MRLVAAVLGFAVLVPAVSVSAAPDFKVGPGGTHATIQSAVDAAIAARVPREIHVSVGRFPEHVRIFTGSSGITSLRLSGGWSNGFTTRTEDPSATVVDAGGVDHALTVVSSVDGWIAIGGFTFTGGTSDFGGGGAFVSLHGRARLSLGGVAFVGNETRGDVAEGAGLFAWATDHSRLWVHGIVVQGNRLESHAYTEGGGAYIVADETAYLDIRKSRFVDNEARSVEDESVLGAGLYVGVADDGSARVEDNVIQGNRAFAVRGGSAMHINSPRRPVDTTFVIARRNQLIGNACGDEAQVTVNVDGVGTMTLGDTLVADGTGAGVRTSVAEGGTVYVTNLTIARNAKDAVVGSGDGTTFLSNTIVFENGADVGGVTESRNLRDDPLFVNPAAGNYHLLPRSPAIDAGDDGAPGGLGPQDFDNDARRRGPRVDIGADEAVSPTEGEPACSILPFVPARATICRCVSEPDLRFARCGALVDHLLLSARVPVGLERPDAFEVPWTILPITPLAGPYAMSAEALVDGEWVPQQWKGPTAQLLKDGQPVVEPFVWKLPQKGLAPVRTRIKYVRPGFAEGTTATIEVTLPEPVK